MGGLIILVILIPVVFLILLISILSHTSGQRRLIESLNDKLSQLSTEISELTELVQKNKEELPQKPLFKKPPAADIIVRKEIIPPVSAEKKEVEKPVELVLPEPIIVTRKEKDPIPSIIEFPEPIEKSPFKKAPRRDWERFIGENLANKIGIAVLVLGIAFFVKYAIDKNWIRESGRIIIGLISGGILIALAHRFRNIYRSFSSVLVGGGLSVFYLTVGFAFHEYHLIGQTGAFVSMIVISCFAVILSLFYKRQELAILATIGGFITPFLVSTGQSDHISLFTYLCILNCGLIALSWFKRWPAINIIALFFTTIIYGGWLIREMIWESDNSGFPYQDALLFAILFYVLFMVMSVINTLRLRNKFGAFDFILLLSIHFLFYLAGIAILDYLEPANYKGLFTASLGVINLLLMVALSRKKSIDRNFLSLVKGLSITFISMAAPVQFKANYVTLFWAAEAVLLVFLYLRTQNKLLRLASYVVSIAMVISLMLTWSGIYFSVDAIIPVILNKGFITTFCCVAALLLIYSLLRKTKVALVESSAHEFEKIVCLAAGVFLAYMTGALEINYQFKSRFPGTSAETIYLQLYTFIGAFVLLRIFRKAGSLAILQFLFTAICLGVYLANAAANYEISELLFSRSERTLFMGHWFAAVLLIWLLVKLILFFFQKKNEKWLDYRTPFTWVASASVITILSMELYQLLQWSQAGNQEDWVWWQNLYAKAGLTILWGCCSFVLMWLGMKYNFRVFRIISLSVFTITIAKLFTFDIRNIPPGGKIAAFILLGILLLAVSFMYQRLKKIIIDNGVE